jgi:hypothetical protein
VRNEIKIHEESFSRKFVEKINKLAADRVSETTVENLVVADWFGPMNVDSWGVGGNGIEWL